MENLYANLIPLLRDIAGRKRIVSQQAILAHVDRSPSECARLLDELVAAGYLRRTESFTGQTFYWLAKLEIAGSEAQG